MLAFKEIFKPHTFVPVLLMAASSAAFADNAAGLKALESKNYAVAYKEFSAGAEQGDPVAMANLGLMHARGFGIARDVPEAMSLWQRAAAKGNAQAEFYLGLTYAKGWGVQQNLVEASRWLQAAAAQGDERAQSQIGLLYEDGAGVQQDYKVAASYYKLAADKGLARAQFSLAQLTEKGKGVKRDDAAAFELYKKAAAQGMAAAQERVGAMYASGTADPAQALFWSTLAAKQNEKNAERRLAMLASRLSADEASRVQQSAGNWKPVLTATK
jgi:TPR repeat protein